MTDRSNRSSGYSKADLERSVNEEHRAVDHNRCYRCGSTPARGRFPGFSSGSGWRLAEKKERRAPEVSEGPSVRQVLERNLIRGVGFDLAGAVQMGGRPRR